MTSADCNEEEYGCHLGCTFQYLDSRLLHTDGSLEVKQNAFDLGFGLLSDEDERRAKKW